MHFVRGSTYYGQISLTHIILCVCVCIALTVIRRGDLHVNEVHSSKSELGFCETGVLWTKMQHTKTLVQLTAKTPLESQMMVYRSSSVSTRELGQAGGGGTS